MSVLPYIKIAIGGLLANKSRSALTMLGIVIGIAAVIIVMSVGAGAQSLILNQIRSVGSNLIGVLPGGSEEEGPPVAVMGIVITTLTYDDVQALKRKDNVPHVIDAAAYIQGVGKAVWQNRSAEANFVGTTASYPVVEDTEVAAGRFFDKDEEKSLDRVAVLGKQIADDLFAGINPIGQTIRIKKTSFRVIGVMKRRGVSGFQNRDKHIFIPISTVQKILLGVKHIGYARIKIDNVKNLDQSMFDIKQTLRERHGIENPSHDDFTVRNTEQAISALTNVTNALKFFLAAIAAISLIVGGIGIMNIMLVSVTERIREIGLRKAVGATRKNILAQFLIESAAVTLAGGIIGIIIGFLFSGAVALVARSLGYDWDFVLSLFSIILAAGVSMLVGIIFGFYPAKRAAGLNPIEALRYE